MIIERTQIKFATSELTGEVIGFVSRNAKTHKLKGVREDSQFGKKICLLCDELKGMIVPDKLYDVELKSMHKGNGYVVISATPRLFNAVIKTMIVPKAIYQVTVMFGNKIIYFDPMEGRSYSSSTRNGVINVILEREDIGNKEEVVKEFAKQAALLIKRMERDGYLISTRC